MTELSSSPNATTYELQIRFMGNCTLKEQVKDWLVAQDVESFVEGCVDNICMDLEYDEAHKAFDVFDALGGKDQPLSVHKFSHAYLLDLQGALKKRFGDGVECEIFKMDTKSWQEGWKESLKPVETSCFYVYPPWVEKKFPTNKIAVEIEPGMAFGTGQHQTTVLCLEALGRYRNVPEQIAPMIDVGTGSGILSIAAKKMGVRKVVGTDIDPDAVEAAKANARRNSVSIATSLGTFPTGEDSYNLVMANILAPILKNLLPRLAKITRKNGTLIMSGILATEIDELIQPALHLGFTYPAIHVLNDWALLQFHKV